MMKCWSGKSESCLFWSGVAIANVINVMVVAMNVFVKYFAISGGDIAFFRGSLQIVLFAIILKCTNDVIIPVEHKLLVFVYALFSGMKAVCGLSSLHYITVTQFIILMSLSPVFALLLSRLLMGTKITALKIIFCISIVAGVALVVRPPEGKTIEEELPLLEDPNSNSTLILTPNATQTNEEIDELTESSESLGKFLYGLSLCLIACFGTAVCMVIPAQCKKSSSIQFIFWNGFGTFIISLLAPVFGIANNVITSPATIGGQMWFFITVGGSLGILVNLMMIVANKMTPPTVIAMIRRGDIIVVMIMDAIVFSVFPDAPVLAGAGIVTLSILAITFHDKIMEKFSKKGEPVAEKEPEDSKA